MNTLATHLPHKTVKADMPVPPRSTFSTQRSKIRVWAFSAAVRLSDQDKPIALKLLVELAIVIRMLALLAQHARCATGKTIVARRAPRPFARDSARRAKSGKRTVGLYVRLPAVIAAHRKPPTALGWAQRRVAPSMLRRLSMPDRLAKRASEVSRHS